ncbi:KIAA1430-like protein [Novymonas esmeraldas]|uniref:KIAA1430-like protein n=1 Tax=Novymonas esmeraldas TaxID=1808958 RepID=A0AAW0F6L6_9TRYP
MERERERNYWQHRDRVANQRSRIDNKIPESCAYVRPLGSVRSNPIQTAQVNRDNKKLVEKMVYIMNTGGGVDMSEPWRDHNRAVISQRRRDQEQITIARENAKMLDRLERAQPTYRAEKFEADRRRNEEFAARASRYPYHPLDRPQH